MIKKMILGAMLIGGITLSAEKANAQMVGGAMMVPAKTIVENAVNANNLTTLVTAVKAAGLVETLNSAGPFTVFAPTNDAFTALFAALKVSGIDALTKDQLTPILLAHVVSGNVQSGDLVSGSVPTLNSAAPLKIMVSGSGVTLNGNINVVLANVQGSNGVVHVIDKVIVP